MVKVAEIIAMAARLPTTGHHAMVKRPVRIAARASPATIFG